MSDIEAAAAQEDVQAESKPGRSWKPLFAIAAAVLILAAAVLGFMVYKGALAPSSAAAKYDAFSYVDEDAVTDYIETYRAQVGCADDDELWAQYLAMYGMTPEFLRSTTVRQLIIDREVEKAADKAGLSVTDEELETYIQYMKNSLAMGDDEIWASTLSAYGQSEEGLREAYTLVLLKQKLFDSEVPVPTASDDDVLSYLETNLAEGGSYKHIYYLTIEGLDEGSSYEKLENAQKVRSMLLAGGEVTAESFGAYVSAYCTDDDVVSHGGANGWSIDMGDYSEAYKNAVEETKVGEVSPVFKDTNGYSFVWIDTKFTLPNIADELDDEDFDDEAYLDRIPETLFSYFSDLAAQSMWSQDCQDYLEGLYAAANVVVFPMPEGLSYDVDMSAYYSEGDAAEEGEEPQEGDEASSDE